MENLEKRKQQALVRSIILSALGITILAVIAFVYIIPTYTEISSKIADINAVNADYQKKSNNWLEVAEFFSLATQHAKLTFNEEERKNSKDIALLLKKSDPSLTYSDWVNKELAKKDEYSTLAEMNDKIISGIIPTYSELITDNSFFEKNRITLTDLVFFVENDLLKKFDLTSFSPVGFNNLSFAKQKSAVINIGTYKIPLELSGTNRNLLDFITHVQNSGKITIEDGKIVPPKNIDTLGFSNLLMTMDQISFQDSFEKPEKENSVSVTLVFYARAKSYSDLLKIRASLADSSKKLSEGVKTYAELCTNLTDAMCKNENSLKAIQAIRSVADDVKQLDTQLQASLKATNVEDVGGEFNKLVSSTISLNSLSVTFEKNKAIVDASKKATTSK